MPALKLFDLAQRVCIKNVRNIVDIGDAPYSLMRSVLLKVETAAQLREIETASPQIIGEDEELWKIFVKRDVDRKVVEKAESELSEAQEDLDDADKDFKELYSYKGYRDGIKETNDRIERDALAMKAAMDGLHQQVMERQTLVVSAKSLPKLPRMGGMRPEVKKSGFVRTTNTSALNFSSGSKTKTTTARGVIDRARREAREMGHVIKKSPLTTPTHLLGNKSKPIKALPKGMVESHKRAELAKQPTTIPSSKPAGRPATIASAMSPEERERRRKAIMAREKPTITTTSSSPPPPFTGESELEGKPSLPPKYRAGRLRVVVAKKTISPPTIHDLVESCLMPGHAGRKARIAEQNGTPTKPPPRMVRKAPTDPFMPSKKRRIA